MENCNHELIAAGKAIPRTCRECGLGACRKGGPALTEVPPPLQSELETPQAGRPRARELIAKLIEAEQRMTYAHAQYHKADAERAEAYRLANEAQAAVKTIPELQNGGVIIMDGKAYMLRKGQSIWGTGDPKDYQIDIRDVAE